jgi:hypothetical protein
MCPHAHAGSAAASASLFGYPLPGMLNVPSWSGSNISGSSMLGAGAFDAGTMHAGAWLTPQEPGSSSLLHPFRAF